MRILRYAVFINKDDTCKVQGLGRDDHGSLFVFGFDRVPRADVEDLLAEASDALQASSPASLEKQVAQSEFLKLYEDRPIKAQVV